jgi:hypothetical protein
MNKSVYILTFFLLFTGAASKAPISINGTIDAGVSSGGSDSQFISNGIAQEYRYLHFSIPQINLLLFAPINDDFFFEGRLQSDTWYDGELSYPRFTLANITYAPIDGKHSFSAGRFISPFGFYPTRALTIDRTFMELPLNYSYYVSMSDVYGFWDNARYGDGYSYSEGLMTSVYFGGYSTGLRWDWEIQENKLRLQSALTTVALSSTRDYSNLGNAALTSRMIYNPSIQWQWGISASHGSFMHFEDGENGSLRDDAPLEQYRQSLVGLDLKYGLGFWEIIGEVIYTHWKVPMYISNPGSSEYTLGFQYDGSEPTTSYFSSIGGNLDIKFEPPFFTGSYFAVRLDRLNFIEEHPIQTNAYGTEDWDKDKFRISFAAGYKLAHNIEVKLLASEQTPFDTSLYTFRMMLTAFF